MALDEFGAVLQYLFQPLQELDGIAGLAAKQLHGYRISDLEEQTSSHGFLEREEIIIVVALMLVWHTQPLTKTSRKLW